MSEQTPPQITAASWLMVAALGLVWGGTFMVQKLALEHLPPLWVAAGRIGFAALITTVIWQMRGGEMFKSETRDWSRLIWVSMLSAAVPFMFLAWAQQYVTSAFTGVSMAAVALIVSAVGAFSGARRADDMAAHFGLCHRIFRGLGADRPGGFCLERQPAGGLGPTRLPDGRGVLCGVVYFNAPPATA